MVVAVAVMLLPGPREVVPDSTNIILVGEIRDKETAEISVQASLTGHLVFTTIHANNPREALTRLENMIGMAGINLPSRAVRTQIASATA